MSQPPVGPGQEPRREGLELLSEERADHRLAERLWPVRVGLAVVHHEVGAVELAAGPEVEQLTVDGRTEAGDPRVAQRAIRDEDGHTGEVVLHDLVPHQDPDRVGLRDPVDLHRDHRFLGRKEPELCRFQEFRMVDRRDPVGRDASRDDLVRIHQRSLDRRGGGRASVAGLSKTDPVRRRNRA